MPVTAASQPQNPKSHIPPTLDHQCPTPSGILLRMQNNTECQGTGVESQGAGGASVLGNRDSMLDVGCLMLDVSPISPPTPFDELQARQARADFIQFTKIFFGLDSECPCPSDSLSA